MRPLILAVLAFGCGSSDSTSEPPATPPTAQAKSADAPAVAKTPPDEMDERMRHCPVALDGAASALEDIAGGVRFTIRVPERELEEVRRRAHHLVDFAARRTHEGHGGFDGKGGGRMKNCPVVTDGVTINATDVPGGAQLDIIADAGHVAQLRAETRARVDKFPFVGATIEIAATRTAPAR